MVTGEAFLIHSRSGGPARAVVVHSARASAAAANSFIEIPQQWGGH